MKASDYIVDFIYSKGINHIFGYPGGMTTHLMDSIDKKKSVQQHILYNEQGVSMAACGFAQASGKTAFCYATSGPGATNLITGIANAFYDSIPVLFITGQVNTYEKKVNIKMRQQAFQEMPVVDIVAPICKYTNYICDAAKLPYEMEKAFYIANDGRKGPVVLDIPLNIQRTDIDPQCCIKFSPNIQRFDFNFDIVKENLEKSKRPLFIIGNGIKQLKLEKEICEIVNKYKIPVVSTMPGSGILSSDSNYYYGFIGSYGHRVANILTQKSDCIISMGARLSQRQTGHDRNGFAPNAKIIRVDIDDSEFSNPVHDDDINIKTDIFLFVKKLNESNFNFKIHENWNKTAQDVKKILANFDNCDESDIIKLISDVTKEDIVITTDVGQNQVWVAQNFVVKKGQQILFSSGHGAMGYSLPAAIGAYYATGKPVVSISGDGGFQMNIQELQAVYQNQLPIKMIVIDNHALGMIRHFQEMYFEKNYTMTTANRGYESPNFIDIAKAYGIESFDILSLSKDEFMEKMQNNIPYLFKLNLTKPTYVYPKLAMNKPIYDQEPLIDREVLKKVLGL